jgi:hypothetical protein
MRTLTAHFVTMRKGWCVATPDQDIVDLLGEALGVPQEPDAPVRTSGEVLAERDAHRWRIERDIARDEGCTGLRIVKPRRPRAAQAVLECIETPGEAVMSGQCRHRWTGASFEDRRSSGGRSPR